MTLIVDAGPLIALLDRDDQRWPAVRQILRNEPGHLVLPAPVSAEVDYLAFRRLGRHAQRAYYTDLASGRFRVECLNAADYEVLRLYDRQYNDLELGLADISIVILARRFDTRRILTFDERHFRALRSLDGGSFVLLPSDA